MMPEKDRDRLSVLILMTHGAKDFIAERRD